MKVRYNQPNVYTVGNVRLLPGINTVDPSHEKVFMANAGVIHRIEQGVIEVVTNIDPVAEVNQTYDVAKLRELAAGPKSRKETKAAIAKLAEIEAAAKESEGSDEDSDENLED